MYIHVLVVQVSGGFRTIGLLPAIYRIRPKSECHYCVIGFRVPCQFLVAGPGRSCDDAVGSGTDEFPARHVSSRVLTNVTITWTMAESRGR